MSSDAPFTPPKKKPSIFWWIGGAFLLLLLLFVFQLFGPSPRIIVSPQTTYITGPLGPDGLPDYEKYVLDLYRDGVTPENNAASLIWPALWPGELDPSQFAAIATELGLDHIPTGSEILVPIYKRIQVLQREAYGAVHDDTPGSHSSDDTASDQAELERNTDQLFNFVTEQPWTSDQLPVLAKWARDNQEPLDKLVEASRRPRCYFPSPSLIDQKPESLVMMLLPGAQGVREAGRSLRARAMWHVGEQRLDDAWQDLYAANRIGHLTAHGLTLVEQLVGMAISSSACDGTITMLHHGAPTAEQSRKILRDLYKLEYFSGIGDSIDHMERASFLNSIILLAQGKMDEQKFRSVGIENIVFAKYIAIDWNAVLRKGNSYYDRYAAAARLPTHAARKQAVSQLDNELGRLRADLERILLLPPFSVVQRAATRQPQS